MIPKQSSVWDATRNTSRQRPVNPNALPELLRSLAALRRSDPALVRWIEDGAPNLTDAEHVRRFGHPYSTSRGRRRGSAS